MVFWPKKLSLLESAYFYSAPSPATLIFSARLFLLRLISLTHSPTALSFIPRILLQR
jgi:hypothetical protein